MQTQDPYQGENQAYVKVSMRSKVRHSKGKLGHSDTTRGRIHPRAAHVNICEQRALDYIFGV